MTCQKCGAQNPDFARFCETCGNPMAAPETVSAPSEQQNTQAPPTPPPYSPGYQAPPQTPPQQPNPGYQPPSPAYQQSQGNYNQAVKPGFVGDVFSKTFGFLFKKPFQLWCLSLLGSALTFLAVLFGVLPIVWIPIIFVLTLGLANVFLCAYRGMEIDSSQLFEGFSKGKFLRNAGGIGWMYLWIYIWFLVPIAGPIVAIIKAYSYRFVPYIMLNDPDISSTDALKKSKDQTDGYKGKMFLADLLIAICIGVVTGLFSLVYFIPFIGPVLSALYLLAFIAFAPLISGILSAVVYEKVSIENPM